MNHPQQPSDATPSTNTNPIAPVIIGGAVPTLKAPAISTNLVDDPHIAALLQPPADRVPSAPEA